MAEIGTSVKRGILFALGSSLVFSIMNALVKAAALTIPSSEIVFFRSIIGTVLILFLMRREGVGFSSGNRRFLILRGGLGALYMIAYFYALANMPLLDAIFLVNMSPIFVLIFSTLFLKERPPQALLWIMPIVLFGAMLTIKPFNYSTFSPAAILGVMAAVFGGGAAVSIRFLGRKHHTYEIIFYFMITATVVSIPLMWKEFVIPNLYEFGILLAIGLVSLLAQVFLTKAFTHENAVVVETVRYIGIVFNAFWGFAFWRELPDLLTLIGGSLIIFGCIMLSRAKERLRAVGAEAAKQGV